MIIMAVQCFFTGDVVDHIPPGSSTCLCCISSAHGGTFSRSTITSMGTVVLSAEAVATSLKKLQTL